MKRRLSTRLPRPLLRRCLLRLHLPSAQFACRRCLWQTGSKQGLPSKSRPLVFRTIGRPVTSQNWFFPWEFLSYFRAYASLDIKVPSSKYKARLIGHRIRDLDLSRDNFLLRFFGGLDCIGRDQVAVVFVDHIADTVAFQSEHMKTR